MGIKYFSKKIDSTLRGGIGYEVDAMLDVLGDSVMAVMVPAIPLSKRICVGGYSIIDSTILNETSVANDVKTPVKECFVPDIIRKKTTKEVDMITITTVQKGVEALMEQLKRCREKGKKIIIVDAVTMEHLEVIAKACIELNWEVLTIDPGPFTMKMAAVRGIAKEVEREVKKPKAISEKTALIVAGSANPLTKTQMELLLKEEPSSERVSVSPQALLELGEAHENEVERAVKVLEGILRADKKTKVILVETALHGSLVDLKAEDEKHGYEPGESSERINLGLAEITDRILKEYGKEKIAGMMLTGGDTMESVCRKIGVDCIRAIDNIIPQVDVGRIIGTYQDMPLVVKGGFCGYEEIGTDIVERILMEDEES